jgi:hypothetical protein
MSDNDNTLTVETLFAQYKAVLARTRGGRPVAVPVPAARVTIKTKAPHDAEPVPVPIGQRVPNTKGARKVIEPILAARGLTWDDIVRDDRRRPLVLARREVYFALRCIGWSYPSIAQLCERDHSSVLYAVREWIKSLNATNPNNQPGE